MSQLLSASHLEHLLYYYNHFIIIIKNYFTYKLFYIKTFFTINIKNYFI